MRPGRARLLPIVHARAVSATIEDFAAICARLAAPRPAPPSGVAELMHMLAGWKRARLIGAREPNAIAEIVLVDALVLADEELVPCGAKLVDIGAGAGAPSIPLALMRPDLEITLVEPQLKRTTFLAHAIAQLKLAKRVHVVRDRIEGIAKTFDVALSRATFSPQEWLTTGDRLAPRVLVLSSGEKPSSPTRELVVQRSYSLPSGSPRWIGAFDRR
jgi:16S rRNA (guanine527-N7)-methyltransferase